MRTLLLSLFTLAAFQTAATDIRFIGQQRIDLDALGTNSPWRMLEIKSLVIGAPFAKVTATIEGQSKIVYVRNLPANITKAFAESTRLAGEVAKLEKYVIAETQRLRRMSANIPAIASYDSSGGQIITDYNNAVVNLQETRERLHKLRAQLKEANITAAQQSHERAYFTGQKYGGLEVWDCGVKVAS